MSPTSRRGFLAALAASFPLAGALAWLRTNRTTGVPGGSGQVPEAWNSDPAAGTQEPFPFLDHYEPFPAGQPGFEEGLIPCSFLHPNGNWVVLPSASGGFDLWNWRTGLPVKHLGGAHAGEHLPQPCGEGGLVPGCFSTGGGVWLHGRIWRGGDDGQALAGTGLDGSDPWDRSVSMTLQLDPKRPVAHAVGLLMDGSEEGVYEIDLQDGTPAKVAELPGPLRVGGYSTTTQVSADGRWLLAFHAGLRRAAWPGSGWWSVWSLADGKCRAYRLEPGGAPRKPGAAPQTGTTLGFSLDGRMAYLPGQSPWPWSGQRDEAGIARSPWQGPGFGPDTVLVDQGRLELQRRGEGRLEVRRTRGGPLVRRLVAFPPTNGLIAFGPAPHLLLASAPSGNPWIWNRNAPIRERPGQIGEESLKRPAYTPLSFGAARSLAWDADQNRVAVGTDPGSIGVFDAKAFRMPDGTEKDETPFGNPSRVLTGLTDPVRALAFLSGGLVALAQDGTVAVWDEGADRPRRTWRTHPCRSNSLVVLPGEAVVATGSLDGVRLWALDDGRPIRKLGAPHSGVGCMSLDPAGRRLAVAYLDGWLAVFDLASGKTSWEVLAHQDVAAAVAFHPSSPWLVSLGWDGRLCRWQARTGVLDRSFEAPKAAGCLAWSRDGRWLAIGGNHPQIRDASLERPLAGLDFLWDAECT